MEKKLVKRFEAHASDFDVSQSGSKEYHMPAVEASEKVTGMLEASNSHSPSALVDVSDQYRGPQLHNEIEIERIGSAPSQAVTATALDDDPMELSQWKRLNVTTKQLKADYPKAKIRKMKKFYSRQNALIDQFLQSGDEERLAALDMEQNGPKIKFAIYGSAGVNFCLFIIQMYAAVTTGSLSLFATAADAVVSGLQYAR
jgi:hypothetical protein